MAIPTKFNLVNTVWILKLSAYHKKSMLESNYQTRALSKREGESLDKSEYGFDDMMNLHKGNICQ